MMDIPDYELPKELEKFEIVLNMEEGHIEWRLRFGGEHLQSFALGQDPSIDDVFETAQGATLFALGYNQALVDRSLKNPPPNSSANTQV